MAVKEFKLELNPTSGQAVFVGEVTGTVVFSADEPRSFNAITISLKGCADVALLCNVLSLYLSHDEFWNQEQIPN